jgi:hypothetical protein
MRIITHGCSFTRYKWECWPKYLSWFDSDVEVINLGFSGSGNETISRGVINSSLKYKGIGKIYVMWSGADRYEVIDDEQSHSAQGEATYARYDDDFKWNVWFGGHHDRQKHKYYQKNFMNDRHNSFKTLERILYTQMFLDRHNIEYEMMIMNRHVLGDVDSNAFRSLYKKVDWSKFIFYQGNLGLQEFALEKYPEHFLGNNDWHPCPYTHYQWVKQIMMRSKKSLDERVRDQLIQRTLELRKKYNLI